MTLIIAELNTPKPTDDYIWAKVLNKWISAPIPNDVDDPEDALPALVAELEKAGYTPVEPITEFAPRSYRTIKLKHTPKPNSPGTHTALATISPHRDEAYTLAGSGETEAEALAALAHEIQHPTGWDNGLGGTEFPDYDGDKPHTIDSVSDYATDAHDARWVLIWLTADWAPAGN